ncbi:MAG: hypothetical protein WDZ85_04055, partial [Candidatus Paceibacterota bacterium]
MTEYVIAGYVPVIHRGYLDFFRRNLDLVAANKIFVFSQEVVEFIDSELDYLRKEIRSLSPDLAGQALSSLLDRNVYQ